MLQSMQLQYADPIQGENGTLMNEWMNNLHNASLTNDELEQLLETMVHTLLLYDNGSDVELSDFISRLDRPELAQNEPAITSLFEWVVKVCRMAVDPIPYETLQDCLSLQLNLWKSGVLQLTDCLHWLEAVGNGQLKLPEYNFAELLKQPELPEGYMIQDFHDLLLDLLVSQPEMVWALQHQQLLYEQLGVRI